MEARRRQSQSDVGSLCRGRAFGATIELGRKRSQQPPGGMEVAPQDGVVGRPHQVERRGVAGRHRGHRAAFGKGSGKRQPIAATKCNGLHRETAVRVVACSCARLRALTWPGGQGVGSSNLLAPTEKPAEFSAGFVFCPSGRGRSPLAMMEMPLHAASSVDVALQPNWCCQVRFPVAYPPVCVFSWYWL